MLNILMKPEFITVLCDVYCKCKDMPARYRTYVNDELFAERTWIWSNMYLEEMLQISAVPGKYTIRYELVDGYNNNAGLKIRNMRVDQGPGRIVDKNGTLEVWHAGL